MKIERRFSAGGIVAKPGAAGPRLALISRQGGKVWCLPKGHLQQGETPEQGALREVLEETGLKARITRKAGEMSYWYVEGRPKVRVFKKVVFFVMRHLGGSTADHDFEVDEARWFGLDQAIRKITYASERKLVSQAKGWIREAVRDR